VGGEPLARKLAHGGLEQGFFLGKLRERCGAGHGFDCILVNVTDWKALARAQGGPLWEEEVERLLPVLETLDKILRPGFEALPHDAMPWTGPE
jgi:hypothetical protein